jgi:hypothetical protein
MTLPGVKITIFFERLVIGDASFHAFSEVRDGRDRSSCSSRSRSDSSSRCMNDGFSAPDPECIFREVEPVERWRGRSLTEPRNQGTELLDLDNVESIILLRSVLEDTEGYDTVGRWINGNKIQSTSYTSFRETGSEFWDGSICCRECWLFEEHTKNVF